MTPTQTDYNWIKNIIDSCANEFQCECADKMIALFADKHNNAGLSLILLRQLETHLRKLSIN